MQQMSSKLRYCPVFINMVYVADPEGIANAQKSLGIGQEDKVR